MMDTPEVALKTTPLDSLHRELGGRMVGFAGYSMPVQYPAGILTEHLHCRAQAGLFDVSHMGQASLLGAGAVAALEALVPGDIAGLRLGRQRYTLFTTQSGGILDDLMVAKAGDEHLFLVVNAGRKEVDFAHLAEHLPRGVRLERHEDRALLALQGPKAAAVLVRLAPAAVELPFMGFAAIEIGGIACLVSRSGYTGEDGFEISLPAERAEGFARLLLAQPEVMPIGLGARDSLRLEAGLCLYGNDIDETTNPIEAGLTWVIGKRRKMSWDFLGGGPIRDMLENGPPRLLVGIRPDGRAPARGGTEVTDFDGGLVGRITSGGFGPTLNAPIAMGYVPREFSADATALSLRVRGKLLPARVVPMPFVPHRYIR